MPISKKARDKSPKPRKGKKIAEKTVEKTIEKTIEKNPSKITIEITIEEVFLVNIVAADPFCSFQRALKISEIPEEILAILKLHTKTTIDIDFLLSKHRYQMPWENSFTKKHCDQLLGFLRAIGFNSMQYPSSATFYAPLPTVDDTCVTELTLPPPYMNCQVVNFQSSAHCEVPCNGVVDRVGQYLLGEFSGKVERKEFVEKYVKPLLVLVEAEDLKTTPSFL